MILIPIRTCAHGQSCLWTGVQRSQCLPEGGNLDGHELSAVATELRRALDWATDAGA
jgi:hypothetical protein